MRASGKSTLGPSIAQTKGIEFIDLDRLTLSALEQPDASSAFRELGEPTFRAAEAAALREALGHLVRAGGGVIALGGGTPTAPGAEHTLARAARQGTAFIVYLEATAEELARRIRSAPQSNRPSLTGSAADQEVADIIEQRAPLYRALANVTVDATAPIADLEKQVMALWNRNAQ
jgi:shikimate kinase